MRQAFFIFIRMHNAYGYIAFGMCLRSVFYAFVACSELCENAKWWKRFEKSRAKRKILHRDLVFMLEKIVVST